MKISTMLRYIPVTFALIAVISVVTLYFAVTEERNILLQHAQMTKLGYELESASDYLTEQARYYVQYGEEEYKKAYEKEANETRTRENVLEELKAIKAPEEEIGMVSLAIELSYQLENMEMQAFEKVENGELEEARKMLFGEEYRRGKEPILNAIALFQETVKARCDAESKGVKYHAVTAIALTVISISFIVTAVFFIAHQINKRIKNMMKMQSSIQNLADGNFDVDFVAYESSDEFGLLAKSLNEIRDMVVEMKEEIDNLTQVISTGNSDCRSDTFDLHDKR